MSVKFDRSKVTQKIWIDFQAGCDAMCTEISAAWDVADASYNILVW